MDILMTNKSENNTNHGRARTSTEKRTMLLGSVWFHVVQWSNQTAERSPFVGDVPTTDEHGQARKHVQCSLVWCGFV